VLLCDSRLCHIVGQMTSNLACKSRHAASLPCLQLLCMKLGVHLYTVQ
jgi:hypothetical protein